MDDYQNNGAMIGLTIILVVAVGLEFLGHLTPQMVSVLQWTSGAFMSAQAAAHIGAGMKKK